METLKKKKPTSLEEHFDLHRQQRKPSPPEKQAENFES